jgi:20S proteasome alpha/beta subunit
MTVGVGAIIGDSIVLAADSRVSGDTLRFPDTRKLYLLGPLHLVFAGDLAQAQKALRTCKAPVSVLDFVTELEDPPITQTEWLCADGDGLHMIMQGDGPAYSAQPVKPGTWAVIGSGALYVEGFLSAYDFPSDPAEGLGLCKAAMRACSKRLMCVGGPFYGRIIPCP